MFSLLELFKLSKVALQINCLLIVDDLKDLNPSQFVSIMYVNFFIFFTFQGKKNVHVVICSCTILTLPLLKSNRSRTQKNDESFKIFSKWGVRFNSIVDVVIRSFDCYDGFDKILRQSNLDPNMVPTMWPVQVFTLFKPTSTHNN